jgi:hypothetical protein
MLHRPSRPHKQRHSGLYGASCFTDFSLTVVGGYLGRMRVKV